MKINESSVVEVYLKYGGLENSKWYNKIGHPIQLRLYGASFSIKPEETLIKQSGTKMPLHYIWSISPVKEGSHQLVLDLHDLELIDYKDFFSKSSSVTISNFDNKTKQNISIDDKILSNPKLIINVNSNLSKSVNRDELLSEIFEVEVLTKEGLIVEVFIFIKYFIGIIGFILIYPAVSDIVTKLLKKYSKTHLNGRKSKYKK